MDICGLKRKRCATDITNGMLWSAATVYLVLAAGFYLAMFRRASAAHDRDARTHPRVGAETIQLFPSQTEQEQREAA